MKVESFRCGCGIIARVRIVKWNRRQRLEKDRQCESADQEDNQCMLFFKTPFEIEHNYAVTRNGLKLRSRAGNGVICVPPRCQLIVQQEKTILKNG